MIDNVPLVERTVYYAETEDNTGTKTELGEGNALSWSASDEIVIFEKSDKPSRYILKNDFAGERYGEFNYVSGGGNGHILEHNVAFYPYCEGVTCTGTSAPYTLSGITFQSRQSYVPEGFESGTFPMTAYSKDQNLAFKNLCGGIKLQIKGTAVIKAIEIKGNKSEAISGKADVTIYEGGKISSVIMHEDASKSVVLDCGSGVALNTSTSTEFIIVLPPIEFEEGFTITLYDVDGGAMTKKATAKNTVERSVLLKMPEFTYRTEKNETILTSCPFKKGVNISDWLLHTTKEEIRLEAYLEKDFHDIKNLGFDAVRLPVNFQNHVNSSNKVEDYLLACLDKAVDMAESVGLYIIIDNHGYLGKNFYDKDRLLMTSVFGQLAQRYAGRSDKLVYELFNEPHEAEYFKNTKSLNEIQNEWIAAIRRYDTKHPIIVTGDGCSIEHLADCDFTDRNLIYTFHFYGPFLFTHQGADWLDLKVMTTPVPFPYNEADMPSKPSGLKENESAFNEYPEIGNVKYMEDRIRTAVDFANERNVPIFCGEWGALNSLAKQEDYCYYHKSLSEIFEKNGISWTLWAYRDDFSIFNKEGGFLVESNLNLGLLEALDLAAPVDYESMFQTQIYFYDDYVATISKPTSYNYNSNVSFGCTSSTYSGKNCIDWVVGGSYASVTFEIWPVIDLSSQAAKDYVLSFMIKSNSQIESPGLTVRFCEYDETLATPIQWRYGVSVDNRSFASDNKWHEVRLPMSWFGNMGAINASADPSRPCDWKHINKLEFAAEGNSALIGVEIFIDDVKIVDKAHINTMDRVNKDNSWWW